MSTSTKIENSINTPQLELKHIAPYLPYELKFMVKIHEVVPKENRIFTLDSTGCDLLLKNGKPILMPLSCIERDHINLLKKEHPNCPNFYWILESTDNWEFHIKNISNSFIEHAIFEKLCEWNYDVFGLIPQNLAINKNTI